MVQCEHEGCEVDAVWSITFRDGTTNAETARYNRCAEHAILPVPGTVMPGYVLQVETARRSAIAAPRWDQTGLGGGRNRIVRISGTLLSTDTRTS